MLLSAWKLISLLIISIIFNLPQKTQAQFWRIGLNAEQNWERETIASRPSGICYKTQILQTSNPDLQQREISYCCHGYKNLGTANNLRCEPICLEDCENGICVVPNRCECAPGYYRRGAHCQKN